MRTIAVDMDGVLADALALFLELHAERVNLAKAQSSQRSEWELLSLRSTEDQRSLWKIDFLPSYLRELCAFARFILVLLFRRDAASIS